MAREVKFCDHPGCTDRFARHRWGRIRATDAGWFIKADGSAWCPKHIPEWVAEWRAKKSRGSEL